MDNAVASSPSRPRRALAAVRRWRHRLGLRTRITIGFGLGALALSIALAGVTYNSTRASVVKEHESAAVQAAVANAVVIEQEAHAFSGSGPTRSERIIAALTSLDDGETTATLSLLHFANQWFTDSVGKFTYTDLVSVSLEERKQGITGLLLLDAGGHAGYQILEIDHSPQIVVAVPIPAIESSYFEAFPLTPVLATLHTLLASLLVAAVLATLAAAVLGRWAARRVLRPLREISEATRAISGGRLTTRIGEEHASDLAILAGSFNRMVDELEQRIQKDARFASDVAHELRSPLTTLASALSVIEARRIELPDRSQQALDLLSAEVRRFQRMVEELLEISRFDAGSAEFEPSVVGVGEILRRSLAASRVGDVPLEIPPALERRRLVVDKRRFERVIANLVENAARYAGGVTKVVVDTVGPNVRIAIEDAGPGIPAGERELIFERFSRGTAAGNRGLGNGSGLGLALVTEHVRLHGGQVHVEATPQGGARFVVQLPLEEGVVDAIYEGEEAVLSEPSPDDQPVTTPW